MKQNFIDTTGEFGRHIAFNVADIVAVTTGTERNQLRVIYAQTPAEIMVNEGNLEEILKRNKKLRKLTLTGGPFFYVDPAIVVAMKRLELGSIGTFTQVFLNTPFSNGIISVDQDIKGVEDILFN